MSDSVRFLIHDDYPVDESSMRVLMRMAQAEGVVKPIAVLPDVHFKFSYHTPTGVIVLTKDTIIPKFVNANCGMSFITTPFFTDDMSEKAMDDVFNHLRENISVSTRARPTISKGELNEVIKKGAAWTFDRYGLNRNDLINFENRGSLLNDDKRLLDKVLSFVPLTCQRIGLFSFGVLGYGNHFIELQVVDEIVNKDVAEKFGISKGQLCFMVHGDSRAFGQSIFDFYSKKAKKLFGMQQLYKKLHYKIVSSENSPGIVKGLLHSINRGLNRTKSTLYWTGGEFNKKSGIGFEAIEAQNREGDAYLTSTYCAINYGYANRAYLACVIRAAMKKALGKGDVEIRILCDGNHDSLQKENIDGEEFYVHRNGASRALPPRYFSGHPIFSKTGQPVLLPSALGSPSFLCAATKGCQGSYYSSCHGTGRIIDRGKARQLFKTNDVLGEVKNRKVKIYDYGRGYACEEAPAAFKDVGRILQSIVKYDIAEPVARLKPLAALKGWR